MNFTPDKTIPSQLLAAAANTIDNRATERDLEQERSMAGTVQAFNAIYGTNLSEAQGWAFMVLLKLKRQTVGPFKVDDYVDGSAYFALLGESRAAEQARKAGMDIVEAEFQAAVVATVGTGAEPAQEESEVVPTPQPTISPRRRNPHAPNTDENTES